MTAIAEPAARDPRPAFQQILLDIATLCLVAGSQLGMLLLANYYLAAGRVAVQGSPEALLGLLSILAALLAMQLTPFRARPTRVFWWLAAFVIVASVGEILRSNGRWLELPSLLALPVYFLIGMAVGRASATSGFRVPVEAALLGIYTLWYAGLIIFLLRGDLGFFGYLPGSGVGRLEFRQGFAATELPIYAGLQLPIVLAVMWSSGRPAIRAWARCISGCALLLVLASMSIAAIIAAVVAIWLVLVGRKGGHLFGWKPVALVALVAVSLFAVGGALVESVRYKFLNMAIGEDGRVLLYAQLVELMREQPLGIGKARFVETNYTGLLETGEYPHQNLLGIGAELGIPAMIIYAGFIFVAIAYIARVAFNRRTTAPVVQKVLMSACLAVFVYQQLRGLLQDTWLIRETYFWLGVGVAVAGISRAATRAATGVRART